MTGANDTQGGAELVGRIMAGDRRAEEELVERYSRGVAIIIRRASYNHPDDEDIYQKAFRIALEKIRQGNVREPEKLSGFIAGLARNLAIDYARREVRWER